MKFFVDNHIPVFPESLFTVLLLLLGASFALRALPLYRCVTPRNAAGHGRGEEQT